MSTPRPDRWCCRIVELAADTLPAQQRQRYALEFIAELYGMPRARQWRHATEVLVHAWQLRTTLLASGTDTEGDAMFTTLKPRVPLRCRLRWHDWLLERNSESGESYLCCSRCGRDQSTFSLSDSPGGSFGTGSGI